MSISLIVLVFLIILMNILHCQAYRRQRRGLLLIGFDVPVQDLPYEDESVGLAFKFEYYGPEKPAHLQTFSTLNVNAKARELRKRHLWHARDYNGNKSQFELKSNHRWTIYKALEMISKSMDLPGRICVLRVICEAAELPFDYQSGLFGELLHILLTPSSSADALSEYGDNEYFHAENLGRMGAPCKHIFKDCKMSPLDLLSRIETFTEEVIQFFG